MKDPVAQTGAGGGFVQCAAFRAALVYLVVFAGFLGWAFGSPWQVGLVWLVVAVAVFNFCARHCVARTNRDGSLNLDWLNAVSCGFVILDRGTRHVLAVNDAALSILGWSRSEMLSKPCSAFFVGPKGSKCCGGDGATPAANVVVDGKKADGTRCNLMKTTSFVTIEGRETVVESFFDVTRYTEQQDRLQQFSEVVRQMATSVVITDKQGVIEYVNPRFTEVTGYDAGEVIGKRPSVLRSGRIPRDFYAELWKDLLDGKPWRGEFENRKKNGDYFWELAVITPLFDESGEITHFVAVKEDVSGRKRVDAQLRRMHDEMLEKNGQLAEVNAEKNEILSTVAHDLRNPLCSVLGLSELIASGMAKDRAEEFAKKMVSAVNQAIQLLNNMLNFQVIESGRMVINLETLDLAAAIRQAVGGYSAKAEAKGIQVVQDMEEGIHYAKVDKIAFVQVLDNLVSNAIKFSLAGGTVWISLARAGNEVVCSVLDSGPGIGEEEKGRLFKKFSRLSARPTGGESSTGLGLSIVQRFVIAMGGRVWCENATGRGAEFKVAFTAADPVPPAS